jgi:hypothetical protein
MGKVAPRVAPLARPAGVNSGPDVVEGSTTPDGFTVSTLPIKGREV